MIIRPSLVLLALLAVGAVPVSFVGTSLVPIDRLDKNMQREVEKKPDDHLLHYNRGRLLYLAVVSQAQLVPVSGGPYGELHEPAPRHQTRDLLWKLRYHEAKRRADKELEVEEKKLPYRERSKKRSELISSYLGELKAENWRPPVPSPQLMREYAATALQSFNRAIELDPDNALYRLGRASLGLQVLVLEENGEFPQRTTDEALAELSLSVVRDQFFKAYGLAIAADKKRQTLPMVESGTGLDDLISYEAGKFFLELCKRSEALRKGQATRIGRISNGLTALEKLPPNKWITPVLLADQSDAELESLLDPSATTTFDLDGLGRGQTWPWLKPDTAILVWDPYEEANITSGWQLFGSVSFRLFLRDGYEALSLLDDDGDGYLRDFELRGLALWRDANQDGRSTPEEVTQVWREGITAIATRPGDRDPILTNRQGVQYEDGRQLPSFDWVTQPLPRSEEVLMQTSAEPEHR